MLTQPAPELGGNGSTFEQWWERHLVAYEEGYRKGVVNGVMIFCGLHDPTWVQGRWTGYGAGLAEWENVAPGLAVGRFAEPYQRLFSMPLEDEETEENGDPPDRP